MKELIVTKPWYESLFTGDSKNKLSKFNIEFWQRLDTLQKNNPEHQITVVIDYTRKFQGYTEVLAFQCDNNQLLKQVEDVMRVYYHEGSLELYPEHEGRDDLPFR